MRIWQTKIDNTAPASTGILAADEDNVRGAELATAVTASGLALDPYGGPNTRTNHLAESLTRHASLGLFCTDTGSSNATVLAISGTTVAPTALFRGLRVKWYSSFTNTGAVTINAFGLGAKKFLTHDSNAMVGGEVLNGREIEADYDPSLDGGAGAWRIAPWANALLYPTGGGNPNGTQVVSGEGVTVNTSSPYDVKLNFPGLTAGTPVDADIFAFYHADTNPPQGTTRHKTITWADLASRLKTTIINQLGGPTFHWGDVGSTLVVMTAPSQFVGTPSWVSVPNVQSLGFGGSYVGSGLTCAGLKAQGINCPGPDNGVWMLHSSQTWADGAGGASSGDRQLGISFWIRVS